MLKVLVAGAVLGRFEEFFAKVSAVNAKSGPFDACLCAGDFWGSAESTALAPFRNGRASIAVPTYFAGAAASAAALSDSAAQEMAAVADGGGVLCKNLSFLGDRARVATLPCGLRVAALSREESAEAPAAIAAIAAALGAEAASAAVDVLLSSAWPAGVVVAAAGNGAAAAVAEPKNASPTVAAAVRALKPRYHFASDAGSGFFARLPYRNGDGGGCTRFLSLAKALSPAPQRFLYAIATTPAAKATQPAEIPLDATASPWEGLPLVLQPQQQKQAAATATTKRSRREQQQQPAERRVRRRQGCWFCLGNPECETHLVAHVGTGAYVALAKGPLCEGHVLVSPIEHAASVAALPDAARAEVHALCSSLARCIAATWGGPAVAFERVVPAQTHTHVQVVPLPPSTTAAAVSSAFADAAAAISQTFEELGTAEDSSDAIFWFQFHDGSSAAGPRMGVRAQVPASFGRETVAARILGNAALADWRKCVTPKADEAQAAQKMKAIFAPFSTTADS